MSDSAWIPAKERDRDCDCDDVRTIHGHHFECTAREHHNWNDLYRHALVADSVIRELVEALREMVDIWDDLHGRGSDIYPYDGMTIHPAVRALKRVQLVAEKVDTVAFVFPVADFDSYRSPGLGRVLWSVPFDGISKGEPFTAGQYDLDEQ